MNARRTTTLAPPSPGVNTSPHCAAFVGEGMATKDFWANDSAPRRRSRGVDTSLHHAFGSFALGEEGNEMEGAVRHLRARWAPRPRSPGVHMSLHRRRGLRVRCRGNDDRRGKGGDDEERSVRKDVDRACTTRPYNGELKDSNSISNTPALPFSYRKGARKTFRCELSRRNARTSIWDFCVPGAAAAIAMPLARRRCIPTSNAMEVSGERGENGEERAVRRSSRAPETYLQRWF
ncbi:hypothetical protein SCHPADRAFT_757803 [Schizopora paradoxa]|uniref:Uncharacterized protein n=1 Tax=Schizopora paradoxa TaxID=27342 RepID=A0A0H2QY29_9AGAM|nr:hypothetical protein SCHPADRAFT_757803 [Schizopora paradoxa]